MSLEKVLTTNDSAKRVPCPFIKPIVELVKPFFGKVLGGTVIEVWIKFMDHTFKPQHREQPRRKG